MGTSHRGRHFLALYLSSAPNFAVGARLGRARAVNMLDVHEQYYLRHPFIHQRLYPRTHAAYKKALLEVSACWWATTSPSPRWMLTSRLWSPRFMKKMSRLGGAGSARKRFER